jgi:hypothetical protein
MNRDTMEIKQQPTVTQKAQPGMQESYIFGTDSQILLADFGCRWQWKINPAHRKTTLSPQTPQDHQRAVRSTPPYYTKSRTVFHHAAFTIMTFYLYISTRCYA